MPTTYMHTCIDTYIHTHIHNVQDEIFNLEKETREATARALRRKV
jgi:hypothetical protein